MPAVDDSKLLGKIPLFEELAEEPTWRKSTC